MSRVTVTTPLSGVFFTRRLKALLWSTLWTKFEASSSAYYENAAKAIQKGEIGVVLLASGHLTSMKIATFDRAVTMSLLYCVPTLHHFWHLAKYWMKIAKFNLPTIPTNYNWCPIWVDPNGISPKFLESENYEVRGCFRDPMFNRFVVEHRLVTDRLTDTHTGSQHIRL